MEKISIVYSDHGIFEGKVEWMTEQHPDLGERLTHIRIIDPATRLETALIRIDFVTGIFPQEEDVQWTSETGDVGQSSDAPFVWPGLNELVEKSKAALKSFNEHNARVNELLERTRKAGA